MKRLAIALLAGLTAVAAWTMPAPEAVGGLVDELPLPVTAARAGVWFCPGVDGDVDPIVMAAVPATGLVGFSLPVDGETLDSFQNRVAAGVGDWDVGDGLFFHPGPVIVETSTSPSAAGVVYRGPEQLAADGCYVAAKEWFLNGASIGPSETLTLRLFNPLLEQGRVSLEVVSEFGFEPLLDFESVSIGPRSWEDVPLNLLLGNREQVSVRVAVTEGVVIPGLHAAGADGLAVWPGESPSPTWEFPLAQVGGTPGTLSIWNPGSEDAEITIELVGRRGPLGLFDLTVRSGREEQFEISGITSLETGAVLRSSEAVVAAVRSGGFAGGAAASVGAPRPVNRWLVPGHAIVPDVNSFLFVLNSADDPVDVTAGPIGGDAGATVTVGGHSIARLNVSGRGADIIASGPISVAWLVAISTDTGLGLGVPIAEPTP
ncbi:MAG: hypothetical protein HKN80_15065 [Acidimicrobiia bacterium]|nr:hypothetical protein [Acidimicrobiia bacterium]